ncbi:EmrB/QacA subfamily drug resistance transporter [Streptomyces puniciscabiei]|uniref:EmrB/QacA subfamily drug resistance transporter n=1 Tax=Streptomyces puniciscabiei TaxID=164348 RepID=A0A542UL27_9ACTN|nr:MFS transporter [Streptomyces puniciscabiei]TQK99788.1 EmrB/QacA subfamily drug resistance transporter [Streptomyces puniciscabiei]
MSATLTEPAPTTAEPHPRRWAAAVVMMIAALMDLLDGTIVNVAVPSISRDLHASASDLQWVVSAYLLGFAAALIVSGHLGDRIGRRPLFLTGTAGFGLTSLACGIAQSPGQLIAARAVQGVLAAVLVPQVIGSFRTLFTGKERGAAFGMYGAVAGFASAVGLLLGGVLTDADLFGWGWRSVFLVNVPVAVATFVGGLLLVPATRERSAGRPDVLGSLLLAGGLVAIVLPLVQGRENGWPLWGWICLGAGVVTVAALGVYEARRHRPGTVPLLPARAFRLPAFSLGVLVQLLFSVGMQGFFLVFAVWLQAGERYTPMQAGLVTVAFSAGGFLTAPAADGLAVRYGRLVLGAGALLMAGGFGWVGAVVDGAPAVHTGAWPLVPGLLIAGAGLGFLVVPLVNVVLSAVPGELAGGASGIFSTAQQFGGALGAGVVGTVFFGAVGKGMTGALTDAMPWVVGAFVVCAGLCAALPRRGSAEQLG